MKTVVCPDCGEELQNSPRTESERTQAKRMALPVAKRLNCHETWWAITGQPGIWGARFDAGYPGVIKARFKSAGGLSKGWSIGYFGRLEKEEAELRTVLSERDCSKEAVT